MMDLAWAMEVVRGGLSGDVCGFSGASVSSDGVDRHEELRPALREAAEIIPHIHLEFPEWGEVELWDIPLSQAHRWSIDHAVPHRDDGRFICRFWRDGELDPWFVLHLRQISGSRIALLIDRAVVDGEEVWGLE